MSQTKAQLLDNIKDNVQLDARNALRFADTDSSHYVAFKAPATVSSNVTWTLPAADGSANYVLATDGSGTLSWIADPAGQWVTSGSNIYFTGGNVGIGDSSPSNPLSVTGASAFNGDVTLTGASYNVTWDKSVDDLIFNDNAKATFGTSSDMALWHDGSHSHISHANVGNLYVLCYNGQINFETGTEVMAQMIPNGSVKLFHNGVQKFETGSAGIWVTGNIAAGDNSEVQLGEGSDMVLRHNGSNSFIENKTGNLILRPKTDEEGLILRADGAAELFYDNALKIATNSGGASVTGGLNVSGNLHCTADGGKIISGAGDDLQIYHDGSNSYINDTSTGELYIQGDAFVAIRAYGSGETMGKFIKDGGVELYTNNFKAFSTNTAGINLYGPESGDCVIDMMADEGDDDADMWRISAGAGGSWYLKNNAPSSWDNFIAATVNAGVELFYDGVKRFATIANGNQLHGYLDTNGNNIVFGDSTDADTNRLTMGAKAGGDLQIYHDGTYNTIKSTNGELHLKDADDGYWIRNEVNGAVSLYYDGGKVFETKSTGARVTGGIEAYPASSSAVTAGLFYNNSTGASADCRVQIKTYSNQGADPYIHFDAGGTNMIAGMRYGGTSTNMLVLGRGENPQADAQILLRGDGDIMFGTNGNSAESNSGFYMNASGDCANSTDNGYMCVRRRAGSSSECQKLAGLDGYARVMGDGDLENTNNSYGSLSDVNLKQDIVDAASQWADIKALRVRKYRFKSNPSGPLQIGVVAQEVETVSPGLVKNDLTDSRPGSTDTSTTKAVKYSILYMKAIKALQEAMTRIETLETKVAALESA